MLSIQNLSKSLGQQRVIDDLNLEISEGDIFGLLGPNGAGKTTLIRMIMGLLPVSSGRITLFGQYPPGAAYARKHIGYMPQQLAVYSGLSVLENILFFGRIYQMPEAKLRAKAEEVIHMVELTHAQNNLVATLSGGMIRRVMLASALVHRPRLLLLDEPTAGVDPLLRIKFWQWFDDLVNAGTLIIITTHNISEAAHCQKVVFLRKGVLLEQDTPAELIKKYNVNDLEDAFVAATRLKITNSE